MAIAYYPAIIERGSDGFSVFFPDLPGCTSGGDTVDQAAHNARDALRGHLALMIADGDKVPVASKLDDIKDDPEVDEVAKTLVPVDLLGKSVRLNISLDEGLVSSIDLTAEQIGMTRSGFIAAASLEKISKDINVSRSSMTGKFVTGKYVHKFKKAKLKHSAKLKKKRA
jgi:predicted RNase H-like HicB family nuclease